MLLKNVKGLGLKTAQKIIVELSGKMIDLGMDEPTMVSAPTAANPIFDEALQALIMLGFQKSASEKVLKSLFQESPTLPVEDAVRQALRRM